MIIIRLNLSIKYHHFSFNSYSVITYYLFTYYHLKFFKHYYYYKHGITLVLKIQNYLLNLFLFQHFL